MIQASRTLLLSALVCLFGLAFDLTDAFAQQTKPPAPSSAQGDSSGKSSKRTTVNFEDQLVEGQTQKPELFILLQQRNNNFKRLIRLRENFLPEMRKTSEDIGRKGSGN